jgi:hypothetical protein
LGKVDEMGDEDYVSESSLDWSLKCIMHYGDTDIFPKPFEFDAITNNWEKVRSYLSQCDLTEYSASASRDMLMPKPDGTFRCVRQLDPLDSLIYAALIYEMGNAIEANRVAQKDKIACSYRVDIGPDGSMFVAGHGWNNFHEHSKRLANCGKYTHVIVADIADFYNQASHHRIENVLEIASISQLRAKNVENLLGTISARHSRGLPVGPIPSIVFAEACLDDVDKKLLSLGVKHVRYVDDFRVFCRSMSEALHVLQELTYYLYTSHRLALQGWKTHIWDIRTFKKNELLDPQEEEEKGKLEGINDFIETIEAELGYSITEEDIDEETASKIVIKNLTGLFNRCITEKPIKLGLARYLLRRATKLRTRNIYSIVFDNLALLSPVFREVSLYLALTWPTAGTKKWTDILVDFLRNNDFGKLRYVRMWALELCAKRIGVLPYGTALAIAQQSQAELGVRPAAILAKKYRKIEWVRSYKENWATYGPWDRRAILGATCILPIDERRPFLERVKKSKDILESSIAIHALCTK